MRLDGLSERDRAEVERSAAEAAKVTLNPVEVERYLDPLPDSPHGLEYAFYLLGDIRGQTVLDLGCGTGENLIPLVSRGARVVALDISPDLVDLARRRLESYGMGKGNATVQVGSAYETGLADDSVDVVFSMALLHHLDLSQARREIYRILRPGGRLILREPIRFSPTMNSLRKLFPAPSADISDFEHPLTRDELSVVTQGFALLAERSFRLPFVPLLTRLGPLRKQVWRLDRWLLRHFPGLGHFATGRVMCLRK
jgi:SAM-dependent methyltransferase